mmetsp:Transcript_38026/g.91205  ORF Transcript_38026/g.91205 Transcript_38026/m.91205 type:complete len:203 (+) Transcript_38026:1765-2373(+)
MALIVVLESIFLLLSSGLLRFSVGLAENQHGSLQGFNVGDGLLLVRLELIALLGSDLGGLCQGLVVGLKLLSDLRDLGSELRSRSSPRLNVGIELLNLLLRCFNVSLLLRAVRVAPTLHLLVHLLVLLQVLLELSLHVFQELQDTLDWGDICGRKVGLILLQQASCCGAGSSSAGRQSRYNAHGHGLRPSATNRQNKLQACS